MLCVFDTATGKFAGYAGNDHPDGNWPGYDAGAQVVVEHPTIPGEYDRWNGSEVVLDTAAELAGRRATAVARLREWAESYMAAAGYPLTTQVAANALYSEAVGKSFAARKAALEPLVSFGKEVMKRFALAAQEAMASETPEAIQVDVSGLVAPNISIAMQAFIDS